MKPGEVRELPKDKLRRIVLMEARAEPRLRSIQGLWGNGVKGTRGGEKKPGRMTDFIRDEGLLGVDEIERLRTSVPLTLVEYQDADLNGDYVPSWPEFFAENCGSTDGGRTPLPTLTN
jgi:hypothetical protein